jgi:hypothetical protein
MVVDGAAHAVGSAREEVERLIAEAHHRPGPIVSAEQSGGEVHVSIGAGKGEGTVWLLHVDPEHVTQVGQGENGGRTLRNVNVVRGIERIGAWHGAPVTFKADADTGGGYAVIVQEEGSGRVAGATLIR